MQSKPTPGIRVRHSRTCPSLNGGTCTKGRAGGCTPYYEAWVYDRRAVAHKRGCASHTGSTCDCAPQQGTKVRKTFPTLAAAKGWRHDAISLARKGALTAPTQTTLRQAAETWLEGAKRNEILTRSGRPYKPSAIRGYESDLKQHVLDDLGAVKLSELRRRDLQALIDRLVGKGFSGSRVRNIVIPMRAIVRHALERDELLTNPTSNLRLPAVGGRRERVASPDEAAKLLAALPDDDRALWGTAFYAGLRLGELQALAVDHVDLKANRIRVSRAWDRKAGFVDPKSAKGVREVPIPGALKTLLAEHIAKTGRRGTDLIFGRTADRPFTDTYKRDQAHATWAKANPKPLTPIGFHECRHTFVSLMFAAGCSLEEIGDYVGHSSTYMVDRYRHLLPTSADAAAAKLDKLLASN